MKKILTFIPLGIGISAAIIYIFNVIQFRIINNSATLFQILSNLKIYLYVSIAGFISYFLIKVLCVLDEKHKIVNFSNSKAEPKDIVTDNTYEPFENTIVSKKEAFDNKIDDYITFYNKSKDKSHVYDNGDNLKNQSISELKEDEKVVVNENKYCFRCGKKIPLSARFCSFCGIFQDNKNTTNPILKNIINLLEIVILLLIIYFSLNMLFEYKESKDPNFKSPFKVSMTK